MQLRGGHTWYGRFAKWAARVSGRPAVFALAMALIVAWFITGPIFRFNDTWQLAINTATTILTFLMVFVIQNTQSRDTQAIQIKRDELIRSTQARTTPCSTWRSWRSNNCKVRASLRVACPRSTQPAATGTGRHGTPDP